MRSIRNQFKTIIFADKGKDNLYYFKTNHMTLYLQVFNESLGLKQNSMDACFRGFDDADRFNPNSNWGHSAHTTFQSGYNIYFNNPYANSRCWRAMIVFRRLLYVTNLLEDITSVQLNF